MTQRPAEVSLLAGIHFVAYFMLGYPVIYIDLFFFQWLLVMLFALIGWLYAAWVVNQTPLLGKNTPFWIWVKVILMLVLSHVAAAVYEWFWFPMNTTLNYVSIFVFFVVQYIIFYTDIYEHHKKSYESLPTEERMKARNNFVGWLKPGNLLGDSFFTGLILFVSNSWGYLRFNHHFWPYADKWTSFVILGSTILCIIIYFVFLKYRAQEKKEDK